jgi:hypothetical protein
MKRAFAAVSLLFLFPFVFSETIDPPALKVRQICGQALASNARIELRRDPHGNPIVSVTTDDDGRFNFQPAPVGRIYLALPGYAIHDYYPLDVRRVVNNSTCKHPLYIRPSTGTESHIIVSFKRE